MPEKDGSQKQEKSSATPSSTPSPLLEPLLAVHNASNVAWLTDAAMTAAERGVGALYAFLYLGDGSDGLRGEEPASRERIGALARVTQMLGKDPTRLTIDPDATPAVAAAVREGRAVVADRLAEVLPFQQDAGQADKAQRKLGVSEAWVVPIEANSECMGVLVLLMPDNHDSSLSVAGALGRHLAVALSNLRAGDAARLRGELDAVRWIHDERRLMQELTLEMQRSVRHERPLSLLIVRVVDYGELRRKHGAFLAERALRRVAATMEEAMRATDFLGAYKDDSFLAVLVEADEKAAGNARSRYLATLAGLDLDRAHLAGLDLRFDCAVATMPLGGSTREELIAATEQGLAAPASADEEAA